MPSLLYIFLSFFSAVVVQLIVTTQVSSPWIMTFVPDLILLFLVFWAMRIEAIWFIWFAWGMGIFQSVITDQKFGLYSFLYALTVFFVQHARPRLVVVSPVTQFSFICIVICIYHLILTLAFRLPGNGLQLPLFNACLGAVIGWLIVNFVMSKSVPLSKGKDLFT